jgi:hypothetical protein
VGWGDASVLTRIRGASAIVAGHGAWRSLVSALVWGTRGPEFKSRRPDQRKGPAKRAFPDDFPVGAAGADWVR